MQSNAQMRAIMGPFGSGKSTMCVVELVRRAMEQEPGPDGVRRTRWVVVRNTYQQLRDTSIKTFEQWVPHTAGEWRQMDKKFTLRAQGAPYNGRPTRVEAEFLFRALDTPDDIRNLLSLEITGAWLNEFREIPIEVPINLLGRLRYPSIGAEGVGPTWTGLILDSNPPSEDSAYYKLFEEDADLESLGIEGEESDFTFEVFKQPSGLSQDAENLDHLPGGRQYYLRMVEMARRTGKDESWINVHVHGRYGFVVDGRAVYANQFKESTHVWKERLKYDPQRPLVIGADFGLTPAAVIAQMMPNGRFLILDEIVTEDMAADEFARLLKSKVMYDYDNAQCRVYGDPAGMQRSQVDKRSVFDVFRSHGFVVVPGHQSPQIRVDSVRAALSRLIDGHPALVISPGCNMLINGFLGGYRYRRMKVSGERYAEKPEKNKFSHVHDALQYVVSYFYAPVLKGDAPMDAPEIEYEDSAKGYVGISDDDALDLTVPF